jgi:hypothetical protein
MLYGAQTQGRSQDQLRHIDARIAVLEDAIENKERGGLSIVSASSQRTPRTMRLEFGPTITGWPLTMALPLPSGLMKIGTFSETTWPGMVTPAEPARRPGS